jgi:hypothetical protein
MASKRLCSNNKEALRWCRARMATIQFADWRDLKKKSDGIPEGTTCCVMLGRTYKIDKTLIKAVNKWITQINNERLLEEKLKH